MSDSLPLEFTISDPDEIQLITLNTPKGQVTVPADFDDWTGNSFDLIADRKFREALITTAGPTAYDVAIAEDKTPTEAQAAFDAADDVAKKLRLRNITDIFAAVGKTSGVAPGESRGSAPSSRTDAVATRSKRTSSTAE